MAAARGEPGREPRGGARFFCTAGRGLEPFLIREVRARLAATQVSRPLRARRRRAALGHRPQSPAQSPPPLALGPKSQMIRSSQIPKPPRRPVPPSECDWQVL